MKYASIIEAIEKSLSEVPLLDLFKSIDSLVNQADLFLTQDTTWIYSSLDSDYIEQEPVFITFKEHEIILIEKYKYFYFLNLQTPS